jgi:hypothetical protein
MTQTPDLVQIANSRTTRSSPILISPIMFSKGALRLVTDLTHTILIFISPSHNTSTTNPVATVTGLVRDNIVDVPSPFLPPTGALHHSCKAHSAARLRETVSPYFSFLPEPESHIAHIPTKTITSTPTTTSHHHQDQSYSHHSFPHSPFPTQIPLDTPSPLPSYPQVNRQVSE